MRKPVVAIIALALAISFTAGCDKRNNMAAVPDRDGHAATADGPIDPLLSTKIVAGPGEMWHTVASGETLSSIAKQFNETLDALVQRNDIEDSKQVVPGKQLVVPDPNAKH